jgi:hypothetical protein
MVCEGDAKGNRVGANVYSDGSPVSLGGQCVGKVVRADGATVSLTGTIDGNLAYVVLDQQSCAIEGPVQVAVCWVSSSNVTTLVVAYGTVVSTQTGNAIQPSTPIPDLTQLLAEIDAMRGATAAANAAAEGALSNFAGAFDATQAYIAGQYVTYTDGKFYRLMADHAANVTWANTSKAVVTAGSELSDLKRDLNSYSDYLGFRTPNVITSISPGYYTNSGTINNNNNYSHSNVIDVSNTFAVYIAGNITQYTLAQFPAVGVFLNNNDELVATVYSIVNPTTSPWLIFVPSGATKLYINSDYKKADYPNSVPVGMVCYKVQKEIAFYSDMSANKRIKFLAGVIRNNGTGWQFINDANHNPMNLASVSVDNSGRIVLDYGFTAKKVLTLVASPDETFASQYQIGGSVGLSQTLFNVARTHKTVGGMIAYNGTSWSSNYSSFTGFSFDTTTGALTISHPSMAEYPTKEKFMVSATGRKCNVQLGELSDTSITIYFLDASGTIKKNPDTDMRAYVIREFNALNVDANNVSSSDGNFWIFGVMEV